LKADRCSHAMNSKIGTRARGEMLRVEFLSYGRKREG
jgi:hypothetical protein